MLLTHFLQDDASISLKNVTNKLKDMEEQRNRSEEQIQQLTKRLVDTEEGKLFQLSTSLYVLFGITVYVITSFHFLGRRN